MAAWGTVEGDDGETAAITKPDMNGKRSLRMK